MIAAVQRRDFFGAAAAGVRRFFSQAVHLIPEFGVKGKLNSWRSWSLSPDLEHNAAMRSQAERYGG